VPDLAANIILQAYLKVLEMEGSDHLVAAYAACLRQGSGEESYARFLRCTFDGLQGETGLIHSNGPKCHAGITTTSAHASTSTQSGCWGYCKGDCTDGVGTSFLGEQLISSTRASTNGQDIPSLSRHQPDVASLATGLDERDVFLIRSVEWLTFLPETADEALIKSNAVARYFLGKLYLCMRQSDLT